MGRIGDDYGRVSVETRAQSFIVHTSYGLRPARSMSDTLMPGDHFMVVGGTGDVMYVESIGVSTINAVSVRQLVQEAEHSLTLPRSYTTFERGRHEVVRTEQDGTPCDQEDDPESGSFGEWWRRSGHPEFEYHDIDNLIEALLDARARMGAPDWAQNPADGAPIALAIKAYLDALPLPF